MTYIHTTPAVHDEPEPAWVDGFRAGYALAVAEFVHGPDAPANVVFPEAFELADLLAAEGF